MPAYLIGDLDIFDMDQIQDYRAKALPLVERFGGKALALDASPVDIEQWSSRNIVLIEFPDIASIKALFASADYAPLAKQRQAASRSRLIAVQGLTA
ncbi:DUF1330 domain-containing protein [Sphingomonas sp. OTU376]|uniref:DUF1330 domain-containing protein n=1 Tax=Sphingomonas sp. OTU376 TaxID=3043863 RepID=UPI00313E77CD